MFEESFTAEEKIFYHPEGDQKSSENKRERGKSHLKNEAPCAGIKISVSCCGAPHDDKSYAEYSSRERIFPEHGIFLRIEKLEQRIIIQSGILVDEAHP